MEDVKKRAFDNMLESVASDYFCDEDIPRCVQAIKDVFNYERERAVQELIEAVDMIAERGVQVTLESISRVEIDRGAWMRLENAAAKVANP